MIAGRAGGRRRKPSITFAAFLVILMSLPDFATASGGQEKGLVSGRISCPADQPCRGVASLWDASQGRMPDPRRFIIIPTAVAPLAPDGSFELQASPGRYFLGALLRGSEGAEMGPPRSGDQVFMTPTEDGRGLLVEISAPAKHDVGLQSAGWVYGGFDDHPSTGVLGRVIDDDGRPVPGILVFAFGDVEMSGLPLAVSERTDASGEFRLRLDRPGTIYLRTRENYGGGSPEPGEYVGVYGGRTPAPIVLEKDQVRQGLVIETIMVPESIRPGASQAGKRFN